MITLRPYQEKIIQQVRSKMEQGCKSVLIQSPTGSGKTALTAQMLSNCATKGMRSIFVVHRRELIFQTIKAFKDIGIDVGIIASGFDTNADRKIQIASIQTLIRRNIINKPQLIVWDEAHHCASASYTTIYTTYKEAYHIGLTATPMRLDGKGLKDCFQEMVVGPTVRWLIDNGYLSNYRLYAPATINTNGLHTRMGDYDKQELEIACDKPTITGNAITHYKKYADGKKAVVFAVSIQHSKHIVDQFNSVGITAEHLDGGDDYEKRDNTISRFRKGDIKVLSNVELFSEGFNLPSLEMAILLRPTQSLGMYLQQVGRTLRTSEGKFESIILDHSGNCQRHGLPDEERKWTLEGRQKKKRTEEKSISVKICPSCFAAQESGSKECKFCGVVFKVESREVKEAEGDLVEIKSIKRRQQGQARTMADLIELGKLRGYKNPFAWAKYVFSARYG